MNQLEFRHFDKETIKQTRDCVESADLDEAHKRVIRDALTTYEVLQSQLLEKKISQERFQRMLFGPTSEKMQTLFQDEVILEPENQMEEDDEADVNKKSKSGHGRRNLKLHINSETEVIHCEHQAGSICPTCRDGKLKKADSLQRTCIRTINLVSVKIFEIETLKCGTCSHRESAPEPEVLKDCFGKYHVSTITHLAFSRYAMGLPSHRIESFTEYTGLKISDTTQFRLFEWAASQLFPVFKELCLLAANAKLTYRDDSPNKILVFQKQQREAKKLNAAVRVGVTTTNVTAETEKGSISLFFTGTEHAGEVINRLLTQRKTGDPMIAMADASSANRKHDFSDRVLEVSCMSHARRNFYELQDYDKHATTMALGLIQSVYQNDAVCKNRNLSPRKRLKFHAQNSTKFMDKLHALCAQELLKTSQPSLKQAYNYTLKHWDRLTQFLKVEGVPLDNNICEREIKSSIRHRKNSLFFRSEDGALVGDILMSLFRTSQLNKLNPLEYLEHALKNREQVRMNPQLFLPTINCLLSN